MPPTERFSSLAEVRVEKERLRVECDRLHSGLKTQLTLLHDTDFRRSLASNTVGDMLMAFRPLRTIMAHWGMAPGASAKVMEFALGSNANSIIGRALISIVSAIVPAMIDRLGKEHDATGSKMAHELQVSWDRIKEYVNERREAHTRG